MGQVNVKIVAVVIALALAGPALAEEPVRTELIRLQKETGLTLASFYRNVQTVKFADREVSQEAVFHPGGVPQEGHLSRDGTRIALVIATGNRDYLAVGGRNGTGFRLYPEIVNPYDICWSFDHSALVLQSGSQPSPALLKLDVASGLTLKINQSSYVSSQCWSPDGRQFVYDSGGSIRVYDLDKRESREIAAGKAPTWSPDGLWIAFLEDGAFYAIRPSGEGKKLLFQSSDVRSPLWWSPDSRFVAYICSAGSRKLAEILSSLPAVLQLRVRRLVDNSEDYVSEIPDKGYVPSYQWIEPNGVLPENLKGKYEGKHE